MHGSGSYFTKVVGVKLDSCDLDLVKLIRLATSGPKDNKQGRGHATSVHVMTCQT